jgi:hypothetical protein
VTPNDFKAFRRIGLSLQSLFPEPVSDGAWLEARSVCLSLNGLAND